MNMPLSDELASLNRCWLEHMRNGEFECAWHVSDAILKRQAEVDCSSWPRHLQFIWRGQTLPDRRVLIRCYHGLGDTIQFIRFVPLVQRVARETIVWAQPVLVPLLRTMNDIDQVLPLHDGAPQVGYDVDVELSELMHIFRVTIATLPSRVPYLCVPPSRPRLEDNAARIGLVWRSGEWDSQRSIPGELLAALGEIAGVRWVLMQRGPAREEWPYDFASVPTIGDVLDEARLLQELDLLITVDTCSAHLAGALGVPVWTLLPYESDWRWMREREDTPWYPTMRLFRQEESGDWAAVLQRVTRELCALVSAARPRPRRPTPLRPQ
jgi:hypothetical protein